MSKEKDPKLYLIYEPAFAKEYGANTAIMLAFLLYKNKYFTDKNMLDEYGYFYQTQDDIYKQTGLKRRARVSAITLLEMLKIIAVKRPDKAAYRFFINWNYVQMYIDLIPTMYKCTQINSNLCTNVQQSINQYTNNQSTSNQRETDPSHGVILEQNIKNNFTERLEDPDNWTVKSITVPHSWLKVGDERWGHDLCVHKVLTLDKYLQKYPDQRKWILGRSMENFLEGCNEAVRVMDYEQEERDIRL